MLPYPFAPKCKGAERGLDRKGKGKPHKKTNGDLAP